MRILTLCYEYPPIGGGGGRVAQAVAEGLAARGHEVRVQTAALGFRSARSRSRRTAWKSSARRPAAAAPDTLHRARDGSVRRGQSAPGAAHLPRLEAGRLARAFRDADRRARVGRPRLTGVPYVITAHLGDVPGGVPEQTDPLVPLDRPDRPADLEIRRGRDRRERICAGARRARVRPPRRAHPEWHPASRPPTEDDDSARHAAALLFLGRLNPQKNAPFLIDALAQSTEPEWS